MERQLTEKQQVALILGCVMFGLFATIALIKNYDYQRLQVKLTDKIVQLQNENDILRSENIMKDKTCSTAIVRNFIK